MTVSEPMFHGVGAMQESATWDEGLDEGMLLQAREPLFRLGVKRFGFPDTATLVILILNGDLDRIDRMTDALFDATSWSDILNIP
jgi:hypothetical protein